MCLNFRICKSLVSNLKNISNFHQFEVVVRGSETQLQIGENLNDLAGRGLGNLAFSWLKQPIGMTSIFVFSLVMK